MWKIVSYREQSNLCWIDPAGIVAEENWRRA